MCRLNKVQIEIVVVGKNAEVGETGRTGEGGEFFGGSGVVEAGMALEGNVYIMPVFKF